jgi:hypothetical protein
VVVAITVDGPFPLREAASADDLEAAAALAELAELAEAAELELSRMYCGWSIMEMMVSEAKHLNIFFGVAPGQTRVPHSGWAASWQHPVCTPTELHFPDLTAA